ncbi:MAG: metal-dependent transcriptional regulator [Bacteroidetes bacterium]|nr:metal-dependent transcriptional regulator [Bacteroidota bacterium]
MSRYRGTQAEENYIKALFKILEDGETSVSTNALAHEMNTSAASASDMLKKLSEKGLVDYAKYQGAKLTKKGDSIAKQLIRKHRLWEVFLVKTLNFKWDEVHEVAEQLEHIKSEKLVNQLDKFLNFPKFDPHGDPIPDADGNMNYRKQIALNDAMMGELYEVVGVKDTSTEFLKFLDNLSIKLGDTLEVTQIYDYDGSIQLKLHQNQSLTVSERVSKNLYVRKHA